MRPLLHYNAQITAFMAIIMLVGSSCSTPHRTRVIPINANREELEFRAKDFCSYRGGLKAIEYVSGVAKVRCDSGTQKDLGNGN